MRPILPLSFTQVSTTADYGDGVFRILAGGAATPPGYSRLEATALEVDPGAGALEYVDGKNRPVRFRCAGDCQKCNKPTCAPDSGKAEPPIESTTSAVPFMVRNGGFTLNEAEPQTLALTGAGGPVFVTSGTTNLDTLRLQVSLWLGDRGANPVVMHLFRLRDSSETHDLHEKIIAVPVPPPT